jgi:hypothetical protein
MNAAVMSVMARVACPFPVRWSQKGTSPGQKRHGAADALRPT